MSIQNCYVYIIKNRTTGMKYIGAKYASNANPDLLWKTYFSSSTLVKTFREQYGDDDFQCRILKTFGNDVTECLNFEKRLLDKVVTRNDYLNLSNAIRSSGDNDSYFISRDAQRKVAAIIGQMTVEKKNWNPRKIERTTSYRCTQRRH